MTDRDIWRVYFAGAISGTIVTNPSYAVTAAMQYADNMLKAEKERWKDHDTDTGEF